MHILSTGVHKGNALRMQDLDEKPRFPSDFTIVYSPSLPHCAALPMPVESGIVAGAEKMFSRSLPGIFNTA